ncbi:MAG: pentapeptide repeat-containing protein [Scytonematopsis contorta HA4267-MV1]|jgi:uncharacterized protein YjbI with pentapeptide repeats|nr:pentapeptide repeat-containing protein [Scytonematopsis contorta HA4267-MV1]
MFLRRIVACTLLISTLICTFLWAKPALAINDWTNPLSFSNAQLSRRDFSGESLQGAEFSNANMTQANFSAADLRGAVFSASNMTKVNLHGADLTNTLADQVNFTGGDLSDTVFKEALLLGAIFTEVNITGADFSDAILGKAQVKELCKQADGVNSKTGVSTSYSLGCE